MANQMITDFSHNISIPRWHIFTAVFPGLYPSHLSSMASMTYSFDDTKEVGGKEWTEAALKTDKIAH